ncbi:hypothetical protein [Natronorubrum halophilum]|uniref:hypothetical protein n=1 Tax=Natronorubrum halophilum TaxID=1702106 RepID=UPI0010C1D023|nr:hypothetical protein [Natronorubrum halophilum]
MAESKWSIPALTFCVALAVRLLAVPTSLLRLNPYSTGDAPEFANTSAQMASRVASFQYPYGIPDQSVTYETWGTFLFPFWLAPGPSELYAHIFVAGLGAIAVYNVAVISQSLHSPQAGLVAALPVAIYPSYILTHSVLLREAAVLVGITTAARLLVARPPKIGGIGMWTGVVTALLFASIFRSDNLPIYLAAAGFGVVVKYWQRDITKITMGAGSVVTLLMGNKLIAYAIGRFNTLREHRSYGRTVYFGDVRFGGAIDLIAFSWLGSLYFLFTPFPWMIDAVSDVPVAFEGVLNLGYTIAGIFGFRQLMHRNAPVAAGLLAALLLGVTLYGFGTVNYGTAIRHRQMFLWILFIFGSIGIVSKINVSWNNDAQ